MLKDLVKAVVAVLALNAGIGGSTRLEAYLLLASLIQVRAPTTSGLVTRAAR